MLLAGWGRSNGGDNPASTILDSRAIPLSLTVDPRRRRGLVSMLRMPLPQICAVILLGVTTGFTSGILGIGGGVILVPALVYFMGFNQHLAQGTTLALLCLPVGIAAATTYYREGLVQWNVALLLFCGFILGSVFGSKCALALPEIWLKRAFGVCLLAIGTRMVLTR